MFSYFGERVAELRKKCGLSQREFAEKINTSATSVSAWETRGIMPSLDVAMRIAGTFGVSLDWLCGGEPEKNEKQTYADVFKKIVNFADTNNATASIESTGEDIFKRKKYIIQFQLQDELQLYLLSDWIKIRDLKNSGVMDKNLYETWIEGKCAELQKYSYDKEGKARLQLEAGIDVEPF